MHYALSTYYIRRVTLANNSPYVEKLRNAGYNVETSAYDAKHSVVAEFPVYAGHNVRCQKDVSMWEQLCLAAFLQKYWSDNQVSATITFDETKEGPQIADALNYFQYQLKGISLLPSTETSKTFKIFGKLCEETLKESGLLFFEIFKLRYDENENVTFIEFDPQMATDSLVKQTIDKLMKMNYKVDSKLVTPYAQMPYENIDRKTYEEMIRRLKPVEWENERYYDHIVNETTMPNEIMYCDGDKCVL